MKYKYYMHDSKEDAMYSCYEIFEKAGDIQTEDEVYNHPEYENLFTQLYQNEIALVFDIDKTFQAKLVGIEINGKKYKLGN